ncbi:Mediator of RNA polymerase II transcription subunit 17 [Trichinella pseudospiralis]|uniref:Mediator of RNA polymerase II transcription subunit 17 n=1 Tax=Trichinella pseudospiralis TaxID=6337 RepID=A0A0V1EXJ0_TRIPS|nr:Mediator of RNA polymerase II transcription subunit 17 [Trichinella pseudospiralis]
MTERTSQKRMARRQFPKSESDWPVMTPSHELTNRKKEASILIIETYLLLKIHMNSGNAEDEEDQNLLVAVESLREWKVYDISFTGVERYLQPLHYNDHVAELAHNVRWSRLVGHSSRCLSNIGRTERVDDSSSARAAWENVARSLHSALTEMVVLMDLIKVTLTGRYMTFDEAVHDVSSDDGKPVFKSGEAYALFAKRKALSITSNVLLDFVGKQKQKVSGIGSIQQTMQPDEESTYLREMAEMRKFWRLKKSKNSIIGDLSYGHCLPKFPPQSTFEICRKENWSNTGKHPSIETSTLKILLPDDLKDDRRLRVHLLTGKHFLKLIPYMRLCVSNATSLELTSKPVVTWQDRLQLAQSSMFFRDLYLTLCKESMVFEDNTSFMYRDFLILRLDNSHALVISLFSTEELEEARKNIPKDKRTKRLLAETKLQCVFALQQRVCGRYMHNVDMLGNFITNKPVTAPLIVQTHPAPFAGVEMKSQQQIEHLEQCQPSFLLLSILEDARHYILITEMKKALDQLSSSQKDPVMTVFTIMIEASLNRIVITSKDCSTVKMVGCVDELITYVKMKCRQYLISTIGVVIRPLDWQTINSSLCTLDSNGCMTPTITIVSPCATNLLRILYPLNSDQVQIFLLKIDGENPSWDNWYNCLPDAYVPIDLNSLAGTSVLHRIETLITLMGEKNNIQLQMQTDII